MRVGITSLSFSTKRDLIDLSHTSILYYYHYNIATLEYLNKKEEPQETQPDLIGGWLV
jgi:hypothetical protein